MIETTRWTGDRPAVARQRDARGKTATVAPNEWRRGLPDLVCGQVMLREARVSDATALLALLSTDEVTRFIAPPPATVEGFARFISWTHAERAAGRSLCFVVVPQGFDAAVGLFQIRRLDSDFQTAEWGFTLAAPFWGSGIFGEAAAVVLAFVFDTLGVRRLEARAAVGNGRGNGALRKLGAACEGTLRQAFLRNGEYADQHLWSILDRDWRAAGRDRCDMLLAAIN